MKKVTRGRNEKLIPVVQEPGMKPRPWRPIVKVYDKYLVMDYEHPAGFTKKECEAHIRGLKQQIDDERILSTRSEEIVKIL